MAKKQSPEELIEQLRGLITPANTAQTKADNRKAVTHLRRAMNSIEAAIAVLSGGGAEEAPAEVETADSVDTEAPYGRKKDGSPRSRPGRTKSA